jgi:hypothetical protein
MDTQSEEDPRRAWASLAGSLAFLGSEHSAQGKAPPFCEALSCLLAAIRDRVIAPTVKVPA